MRLCTAKTCRIQTTPLWPRLAVLVGLLTLANGCAHGPEVDTILRQAPQGSVYLERIPDRGFKAAHPVAIDEAVIGRTLRGVMVRERQTTVQTAFSKTPATARAFSDEDAKFLAPYLAAGLRQAATDQQVGFQVRSYPSDLSFSSKSGAGVGSSDPLLSNASLMETTSGHVLAQNGWLYLTVTEYKKRPEQPDTINMANRRLPDTTGQGDKELAFEPKEALKPNGKSGWFGGSSDTVFVIDYQQLARMPVAETPVPAAEKRPSDSSPRPGSEDQDLKQIKEEMKKKDAEMEQLRREMEDIRRDMGKPGNKTP